MSAWRIVPRARRDVLGEGVMYSPRHNAVFWTDIMGKRLSRLALDGSDAVQEWAMPEMIGWVIERAAKPGLIAGFQSGFAELSLDPLTITRIADPEPHLPDNRMNDAAADPWGRIWAGTMMMNDAAPGEAPQAALYCLDPDRTWHRADTGYTIANGPALCPEGRWMYHTETAAGLVYRYPLSVGGIGPREPFIAFAPDWGSPDGMTVDAQGGIWIAHWGGGCVSRFTPEGVRERWITLPASQITRCTFAGPNLDRMFVTSASDGVEEAHAGALFEVDPGCRGLAPHCYAG